AQPFEPTTRIEDLLAAAQSGASPAEFPGGAAHSAAEPAPSTAQADANLGETELPEAEFTLDDLAKETESAHVPEAVVSEFIATTEIALASALNSKTSQTAGACAAPQTQETNSGAAPVFAGAHPSERRRKRRVLISAPVRVRGLDVTRAVPDEISTTIDVSRLGLLFITSDTRYHCGMEVAVVFPFSSAPTAIHTEQRGHVVRVENTRDGRCAVAISLGAGEGVDLIDAAGRKLASESAAATASLQPDAKKPIVLAVDADPTIREMTKAALEGEGYSVIAVASCQDAREVLNMFVPALVIAEVEGEGLPGYDLCVHVKATAGLRHVPVVLTTSSAYP
ncbi:MAG: PilZ domain-containing protein, partial [Candidatus Acidiferrales bacterium]